MVFPLLMTEVSLRGATPDCGRTLKLFTGKKDLSKTELLTTAVAAYNSGLWAYYDLSKTGDPDRHTTGRDYSADTIRRAQVFRKFLG